MSSRYDSTSPLQVSAKFNKLIIDAMAESLMCRLFPDKQLQVLDKKPAFKETILKLIKTILKQTYYPKLASFCQKLKSQERQAIQLAISDYIKAYPKNRGGFVDLVHSFETEVRPSDLLAQIALNLRTGKCGSGTHGLSNVPLYIDLWSNYNKFLDHPDKFRTFVEKHAIKLRRKLVSLVRDIIKSIASQLAQVLKNARQNNSQTQEA